MSTKTRIALAVTLVLGTTSLALAQEFDGNLANRYPAYVEPYNSAWHGRAAAMPHTTVQSPSVRHQRRY